MDGMISLSIVVIFFVALFTGNLFAPPADTVHDQVFRQETQHISSLSEQALINAVVSAEQKASNAAMLYDLVDDPDFFIINSKKGTQVLRLRCWGSYSGKPAHTSGGTAWLGGKGYTVFRTTIQPEMNDGHSLVLTITGDGRTLFSRVLTADSGAFELELDVRGVSSFTLEISTEFHASRNPGIYLKNALFF